MPGTALNRLCGSGMDAVGTAAPAIKAGEGGLFVAGGVESMTRAPFVMGKASSAFSRSADIFDTTIGWRFINRLMREQYGVDSMPETAENVAVDFGIPRNAQDQFALRSQQRAARPRLMELSRRRLLRFTFRRKRAKPSSSTATSIRGKRPSKRWRSSKASCVLTAV